MTSSENRRTEPASATETCLLVTIGRGQLLIPTAGLVGVFPAAQLSMAATGERWYGRHSGRTFPVAFFDRLVGRPDRRSLPAASEWQALQRQSVVVLQSAGQWAGFVVDTAGGELQVSHRPFDRLVKAVPGLRGAACLRDGSIAYAVQPAEVVALALVGTRREQLKG